MRCKNCTRMRWNGSKGREFVCKLFGYNNDGKSYISVNSKGEEGCKYTEKQLQKIENQFHEAELEYFRKEIEKKNREKLNKIEDLEDELGCSLEVVFEALIKGIIVPERDAWFPTIGLVKSKINSEWGLSAHSIFCILKDYKKTWFLPSDKEWKDE